MFYKFQIRLPVSHLHMLHYLFRMKFQLRSLGYKSKVVFLCSIANFINAADRVLMPLAIVPMTSEFKWSLYWQGWILSAFAFGYFTSQVSSDSVPMQ